MYWADLSVTIFSPNKRYLREFSWSRPLFCAVTFIQHAGISQWIWISQFRFTYVKGHNFCYMLCNFVEDRFTNSRDYAGSFGTFWDETAKINIIISYQIAQQISLDRTSPTLRAEVIRYQNTISGIFGHRSSMLTIAFDSQLRKVWLRITCSVL